MLSTTLAADGLVVTSEWALGVLAGAGGVIALLFKLLIASKDRELERVKDDFQQLKDQMAKDEIRREKEDAHIKLLIDEAIRPKVKNGP